MRTRRIKLKLVLVALIFASTGASAKVVDASLYKKTPQPILSLEALEAGAELVHYCGREAAQLLIESLTNQKAHQQLNQGTSQCELAKRRYKLIQNELYLREHQEEVADNLRSLTLEDLQSDIQNFNFQVTNINPFMRILQIKGDYVIVGGMVPYSTKLAGIFVAKKGQKKNFVSLENLSGPKWKHKLYLHGGPGRYRLTLGITASDHWSKDNNYALFFSPSFGFSSSTDSSLLPSEQVQSDAPEIKTLAQKITDKKIAPKDKAKVIHDWVAKNVTYDYNELAKIKRKVSLQEMNGVYPTATLTLKKKSGICEEYALLLAALARAAGLKAKVIFGDTPQGYHAWNQIFVDNQWINIDSTWDSINGNDKYFGPDQKSFSETHYNPLEIQI